ncbi:MAG: YdeI/OmpD-associated family protein [Ferruginibacter sp.]
MVQFTTTILKFGEQGEKTGWTYIVIPAALAQQLLPGNKKSFRVKGKLDEHTISGMALIPMGEGDFIMALKADLRKAIGKQKGAQLLVKLAIDAKPYEVNGLLMECLQDEPAAKHYFQSLPKSHQHYFSKWIESAKTEPTKTKRIAMAVNAMSKKMDFGQMLRSAKEDNRLFKG